MAVYGGLRPLGDVKHASLYKIAAAESNDLFLGDVMAADVGGYVTVSDDSNQVIGAALAFFDSAMNPIIYYANASYAVVCYVLISDDPNQEYYIAEDADTSQLAQTDMFSNIALVPGTGVAATGQSAFMLDSNTAAATASLPVKLLRLAPFSGNSVYSATLCPNPLWVVRVNYGISSTTGITT